MDVKIKNAAKKIAGMFSTQTGLTKPVENGKPLTTSGMVKTDVMNSLEKNPVIQKLAGANNDAEQSLADYERGKQITENPRAIEYPTRGGYRETGSHARQTEDITNLAIGAVGSLEKVGSNLTTKLLSQLEGKTTVSKQFIEDLTNQGALRQPERDLIRSKLAELKGNDVNVKEFANSVKTELLPLKTEIRTEGNATKPYSASSPRYENVSLPSDIRGSIANYDEHIYQSPIKTSAGDVHFNDTNYPNYFAHTRIEDMADGKTRRVIEAQSDLFQKGRLETEVAKATPAGQSRDITADMKKLEPYRNTWHERVIREEIKQAAIDGKTALQFPTGETAMKIEGLGQSENRWRLLYEDIETPGGSRPSGSKKLKAEDLEVGQRIAEDGFVNNDWIITDVLGDGKFKAVPKNTFESYKGYSVKDPEALREIDIYKESFDISGKVDTSNPIYKFYEKDVQKFLSKFGGKKVVDGQGVSWIEIPVSKESAKAPVQAFGKANIGTVAKVGAGIAGGAATYAGVNALGNRLAEVHDPQVRKLMDIIGSSSIIGEKNYNFYGEKIRDFLRNGDYEGALEYAQKEGIKVDKQNREERKNRKGGYQESR